MPQLSLPLHRIALAAVLWAAPFTSESVHAAEPTFVWRNPTPFGGSLNAVTFGAGRFVATGNGGRVLTSTDGATWHVPATLPSFDAYGVAFGGNLWVIVGTNGRIFTSTDTVSWTARTSGTTQLLNSVSYASDRFLACGEGGTILVSSDGISWASRASGTTQILNSIAGRTGAYVAVGDANTFLISADTATWTPVSLAEPSSNLQTAAFLANQFVVVGINGRIYSSPDGTTWTSRGSNTTGNTFQGLTHDGSQYIIGTLSGTIVVTANANLGNRTNATVGINPGSPRNAFASGGGVTVAVGSGNDIITTADGRTWVQRGSQGSVFQTSGVASLNNRWFTVGTAAAGSGAIASSPDGVNWTRQPIQSSNLTSIVFGGGRYVVVGNSGYVTTSTDGETWNATPSGVSNNLNDIAYANGRFAAVGTAGTIVTSADGLTWAAATSGVTSELSSVAVLGNTFIAVGVNGVVVTSTNGTTWSRPASGTTQILHSICVHNGSAYAVGNGRTLLVSTNGQTWTSRTLPAPPQFSSSNFLGISPCNGGLLAVGNPGAAIFSPDGVNWTYLEPLASRNSLSDAASDGTTTMVVGVAGTILQSIDPHAPASRLVNVATRGLVQPGSALTPGFVLRGTGSKQVVVRAIGPTLSLFGLPAITDVKLDVVNQQNATTVASNDDWGGSAALSNRFASLGAFALAPASRDAAVQATLPVNSGGYSVRITASGTANSGVALAEVYDADDATSTVRLANVSTLGFAGANENALTPGFVISGLAPKRLLIRAIGPGLIPLGVDGVLADPQLSVFPAGASVAIAGNDDWGGSAALRTTFTNAGAFAITDNSRDAAVDVTLPPGGYTVVTSGVSSTTGTALVEIYDLDP